MSIYLNTHHTRGAISTLIMTVIDIWKKFHKIQLGLLVCVFPGSLRCRNSKVVSFLVVKTVSQLEKPENFGTCRPILSCRPMLLNFLMLRTGACFTSLTAHRSFSSFFNTSLQSCKLIQHVRPTLEFRFHNYCHCTFVNVVCLKLLTMGRVLIFCVLHCVNQACQTHV